MILRFVLVCVCASVAFLRVARADTIEFNEDLDMIELNALREWINTKRQVTVKELGGALSISGQVRTEYQASSETLNGVQQRGPNGAFPTSPSNAFDVEVNLLFDYRADRSWASAQLEFDNRAGIISGNLNNIKLEIAYWGVRVIEGNTYSFDTELGRRRMGLIVTSKLEFNSFFDGIWLRYDHTFQALGDFYVHLGAYVIDQNKNQFGYLGEIGLQDIGTTGLYTKISLVDWDTKNFSDPVTQDRYNFLVGQMLWGYRYMSETLQTVVQFYLAGLYNFKARRLTISNNKKANWGTYAGVSIGRLRKKGDWAVDANYQVLAAQAVPDYDSAGIGLGNTNGSGFYTVRKDGTGGPNTVATAGGNVNFRGFQIVLDYLLTNQLNIQQSWQQAITLDKSIGPFRRYKQYELEFIYGF